MVQSFLELAYMFALAHMFGSGLAVVLGIFTGKNISVFRLFKPGGSDSRLNFNADDYKGFSKKLNVILFSLFVFIILGLLLSLAKPTSAQWIFILLVILIVACYFYVRPQKLRS